MNVVFPPNLCDHSMTEAIINMDYDYLDIDGIVCSLYYCTNYDTFT